MEQARILVVIGTRPEAIKMVPVILELLEHPDQFRLSVCSTGQHRELLEGVFRAFGISPDYSLGLMRPDQSLNGFMGRALQALDPVLEETAPDVVLVQGDTSTALAGALAAFYRQVAVGHVEAGLRTPNPNIPFPEEMNRRLIGRIAVLHFAPTPRAVEALRAEGVPEEQIYQTGNTAIDTLRLVTERFDLGERPPVPEGKRLILVTTHRRENFGSGIRRVCEAIRKLVVRNPEVVVLYSVHPNPKVREVVHQLLGGVDRVQVEGPLDYFAFVRAMESAYLILTDSGGVQEEASALRKPILVLREVTERPEAVECGAAELVGTEVLRIVHRVEALLNDPELYRQRTEVVNPFGDGYAAQRIVSALRSRFLERPRGGREQR